MVKTIIGGMEIQQWIKSYSCQCPPVTGNNGFFDIGGNYISDKKGDEVLLDIVLEDVPTPVSVALAKKLEAPSVEVDYTTPVPKHDAFYKTSYSADCDDADPDQYDFEITDGILWTIRLSLRSAGLSVPSGGL
ncbi:MAG: hypothetical protein K1W17_14800 [Oscillospiraceae bacterium]